MTKISVFADRLMEAGWIAAIITTPLFFNVFSSRIFEPDKITLLRSISLLVLVSWILKALENLSFTSNRPHFSDVLRLPLMGPVLLLVLNYLISTAFSVAPFVSLWGSYQRLQGTFTTYSYLILFLSLVFNRPSEQQIRRLITVAIVVSLPVAVYGLLQRYKIDPIPWGGDVSVRIASTMGNSIFVAAYLIMVFPLTLGRLVESFRRMLRSQAFELKDFLEATAYTFTGLLQVIALYFSGSRGPALGWLSSVFFFALCLVYVTRKRTWGITILVLSILVILFLIVFNLPNSPFESLKQHPSIGRFGQLLDPQSNNARVRTYIWQGAVKLYGFHPPLEYPDGKKDIFNWVRPLIGYGPETMYVAYNRFYVPDLTRVERRNASPDRSHNETWDALIITGAVGFFVYIAIFLSLFFYGFKVLGLITSQRDKTWFFGIEAFFGIFFSFALVIWRGAAYFGIAFPLGLIAGIFGYLGIKLLLFWRDQPALFERFNQNILVVSLLAAILAHLIEINFGIAIASTRTYFWVYAAILVLVNVSSISEVTPADEKQVTLPDGSSPSHENVRTPKRKKRVGASDIRVIRQDGGVNKSSLIASGVIVAIILVVLGYNFMNATEVGSSALKIIWSSFTEVRKEASFHSNGILIVIILSWLVGGLLLSADQGSQTERKNFIRNWIGASGISLSLTLIYWLIHGSLLASIVATPISNVQDILSRIRQYEGLLVGFYLYLFVLMVVFALSQGRSAKTFNWIRSWLTVLIGLICVVLSLVVINQKNIRVIQADIAFKLGESFAKPGSWPVSIQIYQHAIELAPREDYYYLFLGRSYLEHAREINDENQREALFQQAKTDLLTARSLNPLNTDHTANLARLYSLWSLNTKDEKLARERFLESNRYFEQATSLSPNNSRIWGEWAVLLMSNGETLSEAMPKLLTAYQLDPTYDWIAYLFGEYYRLKAAQTDDFSERSSLIKDAISNYLTAVELTQDYTSKKSYYLMVAQLAIEGNLYPEAIQALEKVLIQNPTDPENWRYEQRLAELYLQQGEKEKALIHARNALMLSPAEQKQSIEALINQINIQP